MDEEDIEAPMLLDGVQIKQDSKNEKKLKEKRDKELKVQ